MISRRDWVPFEISASGRVDHVDECTSLSEIVEELVPQTAARMSLWNETGDIKQLDGDETRARFARRVGRFASAAPLFVRANLENEGHASVRLDGREGIVCAVDWRADRRTGAGGVADCRV